MKMLSLIMLFFTFSAWAMNSKFASLVEKARDLEHDGKKAEAIRAYKDAVAVKDSKLDKLPVLIELVRLHRDDKKNGIVWLNETDKWLNAHPSEKEKFSEWSNTMRGHFTGKVDPQTAPPVLKDWATNEKVSQLMNAKKFPQAWALVKDQDLTDADLRTKIIYDVLSGVVEKDRNQRFYCEDNLKRHPSSQAWTIKTCRYLKSWKEGKADLSLKKSVITQIGEEEPKSSYVARALEEL